ncbi:sigma-70 family RNA polymerase sigma factor [Cohnella nanjingensis]|uniref:Sigma-70 family RNA polymerase sigma factor n=1 Tax=Cohnella nanjingensis TaxID=1387779 RepID=A0A7X0VEI2_9BACL|nr:sigma-70 family RNA polymerase sigma factor [Cohnella nanjingensis]MBB6669579.1 sigma-70 family RNA polymerase sigma factor [Cohnella nanjingensis]
MGESARSDVEQWYETYRRQMFNLAYRLLGIVSDAEDAVQDVFVALAAVPQGKEAAIRHPRAYLSKLIANRCLNVLKSARRRRESYVGEWLPEPIVESRSALPHEAAELDESMSYAFLVLLERLTPTERAVFVLREALQFEYAEIGEMLGKSEANCRQLFSRSKRKLTEKIAEPAREAAEAAARDAERKRLAAGPEAGAPSAGHAGGEVRPSAGQEERQRGGEHGGGEGLLSAGKEAEAPSSGHNGGGGLLSAGPEEGRRGGGTAASGGGGAGRAPAASSSYALEEERVRRFIAAFRLGRADELARLLTQDAVLVSDGGGKTRAAIKPIYTRPRVIALLAAMASGTYLNAEMTVSRVNGRPGITLWIDGVLKGVIILAWNSGAEDIAEAPLLTNLYFVVNPDKLAHLKLLEG